MVVLSVLVVTSGARGLAEEVFQIDSSEPVEIEFFLFFLIFNFSGEDIFF